jgi:O-antigen/teichoic acid export membrane protein
MNVVTGVLLARALGPHDRGVLAAVVLWPSMLAAVGSLGNVEATTFHAGRMRVALGSLVSTTLMIAITESLVLVGLGLLIAPIVYQDYGSGTLTVALLFLTFIPLNLSTLSLMAVLNGVQRFQLYQILRLSVVFVTLVLLAGLALAGELSVESAVVSYLAANAITTAAAAILVAHAVRSLSRPRLTLARQLLSFGLRSHTSAVPGLFNQRLDQLVISVFLAPAKLGLYVIATTLTSATAVVGYSVAMVALPTLARLEPGTERTATGRRLVVLTLVLSAGVSVPLFVLAPQIIDVFFGRGFHAATDAARVLLIGAVFFSMARTLEASLQGVGRPLSAGAGELVALGVTLIGLAVLLPMLGLVGAALASVFAYGISAGLMTRRLARILNLPWHAICLPHGTSARFARTGT